MRCSCSQQTFILSISFNHIPSTEKSVPFFYTTAKTMFFSCFFSRVDLKWPGSVMGWRPKNPQGFKQSQIIFAYPSPSPPPPCTHPHPQKDKQTNRQTKKQKEKISSLMKPHSHKKYLVKFSTPQKSRNQKTSNPPPQNPSIAPLIWNPDFPRLQGGSSDAFLFSSTLEEF